LHVELPLLTRITLGIGDFLQNYGAIFVPAVIALLVVGGIVFSRFFADVLLLSLPGVRRLVKEAELSRFGFTLGSLLEAGLPVSEALDSLVESTTLKSYRTFYANLSQGIKEGSSFAKVFSSNPKISRLFPVSVRQVTISAEQSGRLPEALIKIGQTYETRLEDTAKNLTVALEPALLLVVWFGVVLVALSVVLPIYSLIGGFNP
jgi:type II secretory pathway component PulF